MQVGFWFNTMKGRTSCLFYIAYYTVIHVYTTVSTRKSSYAILLSSFSLASPKYRKLWAPLQQGAQLCLDFNFPISVWRAC
jgi:hypothetical protein